MTSRRLSIPSLALGLPLVRPGARETDSSRLAIADIEQAGRQIHQSTRNRGPSRSPRGAETPISTIEAGAAGPRGMLFRARVFHTAIVGRGAIWTRSRQLRTSALADPKRRDGKLSLALSADIGSVIMASSPCSFRCASDKIGARQRHTTCTCGRYVHVQRHK
jgi:hypothetical protein